MTTSTSSKWNNMHGGPQRDASALVRIAVADKVGSDTQNPNAVHDLRRLALCDTLLVPDCLKPPMIAPY